MFIVQHLIRALPLGLLLGAVFGYIPGLAANQWLLIFKLLVLQVFFPAYVSVEL